MRFATRLLVLALAASPSLLFAQKKDDFIALQRDVAQLEDEVQQLQKSQNDKIAALTQLAQQTAEAANRASAAVSALQRTLNDTLTNQQSKLLGPVADMGAKTDALSQSVGALTENMAGVLKRLDSIDSKLNDVSTAVRTLNAPPVAPPSSPGGPGASLTAPATPTVAPETAYENARRDDQSGKDKLALDEYAAFVNQFPQDANAPNAQFNIAGIYDRANQFDDAADAYAAVLKYPKNPRTCDAMYMQGVELMKAKHKTDASDSFKHYIKSCPYDDNVAKARAHLRTLGTSGTASKKRR